MKRNTIVLIFSILALALVIACLACDAYAFRPNRSEISISGFDVANVGKWELKAYYPSDLVDLSGIIVGEFDWTDITSDISNGAVKIGEMSDGYWVFEYRGYDERGEAVVAGAILVLVSNNTGKTILSEEPSGTVSLPTCEHSWEIAHDATYHWEQCSICGLRRNQEKHTFRTIGGKEVCDYCGYEKEESSSPGFDVDVESREPSGELTAEYNSSDNTWTFTFTDDNAENEYRVTSYTWLVNNVTQTGETGSVFTLATPQKRSYRVTCVFRNEYGINSSTYTVTGV